MCACSIVINGHYLLISTAVYTHTFTVVTFRITSSIKLDNMVDSGPVSENKKIWIVMHVKVCLLRQRKIGLFIVHYRSRECRSHLKDNHTSCWRDYYPVARRWFHIWLAWAGSLDGDEKQSLSSQVFRPDFRSLIHFLRRHCQSLVGVRHISCELPPYALETALASRQIHDSRQSGRRRCQLTEEVWRILTHLEKYFLHHGLNEIHRKV